MSDGQDLASTEWADDITVWPCPARMDQRPGGPRGLAASNGLSASTSAVPR